MTRYSRQDLLRILHLQPRQLSAWERQGLVPVLEGAGYGFGHLALLRKLAELHSQGFPAARLRAQLEGMRQRAGVGSALTATVRPGTKRLAFRHGGALVDALTQQLAFDFELAQQKVVNGGFVRTLPHPASTAALMQEMFLRGVQLEESAATLGEATAVYEAILELKPNHAAACINLGTIFYNQKDFPRAEAMYRRATESDPEYALAFFDLGNVLDEMQRLPDAIAAYGRAIALVPGYADAHYNLALALERQNERRRALRHWLAYTRLDPVGPWAAHAKTQARRILSMERLAIVARAGRRVSA